MGNDSLTLPQGPPLKYQIAEYTVDTTRYRISHGGAVIPAGPKVFDLLVYLIRHRDRVLSREGLFREVWDGREVSDATLSNHVKSARKILGDSGELQRGVGAYIAGDYRRAVQLAERGAELDGSPVALIMLAQAYGYAGQKEKVLPLLEKAASAGTYVCPYESAAAYLSLGEQEQAMTLLDDAVAKRSNCLIFLRNDPRLAPIRQQPHYQVLLNRVGLDDLAVASYKR